MLKHIFSLDIVWLVLFYLGVKHIHLGTDIASVPIAQCRQRAGGEISKNASFKFVTK